MRANPGGQLSPTEIIGRDKLIERIWRSLERQSVILSSERRIGKTSILTKMKAEADPATKVIYFRDLERVYSPLEFVETVLADVEDHLSLKQKSAIGFRKLLSSLAGLEAGGAGVNMKLPQALAPHWKDLLVRVVNDLIEQEDRTVYFFWDEIPLMLYNIKERVGEPAAMEILDTLRSLRQTHQRLRMVYTGSIGLHNVLMSLRKAGYANDPTNDMDIIDVLPLGEREATDLARLLLEGENVVAQRREEVARAAALAVDGFPFYIHHVVDEIARRGGITGLEEIEEFVMTALTDAQDRWHLRYYRERIDTYYSAEERPIALGLLDVLAARESVRFEELCNLLKHRVATENVEEVREVLVRLIRDYYISQSLDGNYRFRFGLIKRAWQMQRG